jgi:hypothetical protein
LIYVKGRAVNCQRPEHVRPARKPPSLIGFFQAALTKLE